MTKFYFYIQNFFLKLLNYLDYKHTLKEQERLLKSFWFFGVPIGLLLPQLIFFIFSEEYSFKYSVIISTFIFDIIFTSPLIFNYFRHIKIYRNFYLKVLINQEQYSLYDVKSKYNYLSFNKNEIYKVKIIDPWNDNLIIITDGNNNFIFKNIVNKFDIDSKKQKRKEKLNKIKSLYK